MAPRVKDLTQENGHGPASRLVFLDHVPGPCTIEIKPGESELVFDEVAEFKRIEPSDDWDSLIAERDEQINSHVLATD